jgi:Dolichyl-phosphate-mannose-protein mannosyltransferase
MERLAILQCQDTERLEMNIERGEAGSAERDRARHESLRTPRIRPFYLGIMLAGAGVLYLVLYNPSRFGSYHDDAIYVATAKALATGEGYKMISLPYEPAATKYPPLYPFLLSLIWRLNPSFPGNVNWMVILTAASALAFLGLTWCYLVSQDYAKGWQAFVVVAMTAINWRMVIYATGIYSEMVYAALTVGALFLAERVIDRRWKWTTGLGVGVLLGLAFLTRTAGIALILSVAVYLLTRRSVRPALLPLAVAGLFVFGWLAWSKGNRTTVSGVNVSYYTDYLDHFKNVLLDIQFNTHASMLVTILGVLWKNLLLLVIVSVPAVSLSMDYTWVVYLGFVLMFIVAGFVRDVARGWRLLHIYVICHLGFHVVGLPFVSYDRYLAPILPFLLLWLVRELESMASLARATLRLRGQISRKVSAMVIGLAVAGVVAVAAYNYGSSLYSSLSAASLRKQVKPTPDDSEAITWISANTDPTDVIICGRDPMYYLYTGRKATRSFPMTGTVYWQDKQDLLFRIIDEAKANYLVVTASDFEEEYQSEHQMESLAVVIQANPSRLEPVFRSESGRASIYRIRLAPPSQGRAVRAPGGSN